MNNKLARKYKHTCRILRPLTMTSIGMLSLGLSSAYADNHSGQVATDVLLGLTCLSRAENEMPTQSGYYALTPGARSRYGQMPDDPELCGVILSQTAGAGGIIGDMTKVLDTPARQIIQGIAPEDIDIQYFIDAMRIVETTALTTESYEAPLEDNLPQPIQAFYSQDKSDAIIYAQLAQEEAERANANAENEMNISLGPSGGNALFSGANGSNIGQNSSQTNGDGSGLGSSNNNDDEGNESSARTSSGGIVSDNFGFTPADLNNNNNNNSTPPPTPNIPDPDIIRDGPPRLPPSGCGNDCDKDRVEVAFEVDTDPLTVTDPEVNLQIASIPFCNNNLQRTARYLQVTTDFSHFKYSPYSIHGEGGGNEAMRNCYAAEANMAVAKMASGLNVTQNVEEKQQTLNTIFDELDRRYPGVGPEIRNANRFYYCRDLGISDADCNVMIGR